MAAVTANSNPDVPVAVSTPTPTPTAVSAWNKKPEAAESGAGSGSGNGNGNGSGGGNGNGSGVPAVVMGAGAELWPSLSECTSKTSSSSKFDFAGSSISHKVKKIDTPSSTIASMSVRSPPSNSPKPTKNNSNHHSTSNHGRPARQKSMKQANGGNSHQSSQPAGEVAHSHHHNHGSPKPNSVGSENPGRDNVQNHGQREPVQRNAGGDHPHQRNPFRKGNGGPHSRGDGSHQNYGGRRSDQERGNHDFNHQRNFNGREASMQPRGAPKNFMRGPPVPASFIYAPPGPPFVNPTMPVFLPPGMQFVAPFYFPLPCPELYLDLMRQIDYYFSHENLVRDVYLRGKMDEQGWVPVEEIAKFQRVKCLAKDTSVILEAVRFSNVVEVQGDKIRCRDDWHKWTMKVPTSSGSQSPKSPAVSGLTDQVGSVSLDEKINHPGNVKDQVAFQASSGGSNTASQMSVNEANPNGC